MRTRTVFVSLLYSFLFLSAQKSYGLEELRSFGSNPGNLKCFVHYPKNYKKELTYPLVVALHGCSQSAENIAIQSGWNDLADKNDFIVLYPEQKMVNNASKCFNWFLTKDTQNDDGELGSIHSMINTIKANANILDSNVFVYGLSAGAAMSVVLLANYPTEFKAGAIFAGGPYGMAGQSSDAWRAMRSPTPQEEAFWLSKLPYPTSVQKPSLIVCHGTKDPVVDPTASQELIKQWCAWHNINYIPTSRTTMENHPKVQVETYGEEKEIKFYQFSGLGHVLPIDPGNGEKQGGQTGVFARDEDYFSTYYIAEDFGLIK